MALIRETDTGTPIRVSDHLVTLTVDGTEVSVARGPAGHAAMIGAALAFAVWAVLELGWGVNPFRRILGVAGLLFLASLLLLRQ